MAFPVKDLPMKTAKRGGGSLGCCEGGRPDVKPLPMKEPVGPKRPGSVTNHGKAGTQHKG